jgi:hypothetical protein
MWLRSFIGRGIGRDESPQSDISPFSFLWTRGIAVRETLYFLDRNEVRRRAAAGRSDGRTDMTAIVRLLAEGLTPAMIAAHLGLDAAHVHALAANAPAPTDASPAARVNQTQ